MGYLAIIRPINCVITFISVLVGAWIGTGFVFSYELFFAGLLGFIVCAFGNIINDLQDLEIDKINNPERPLPSGRVDIKAAKIFAILLFCVSLLLSVILGLLPFLLVLAVLILLFFYAVNFKKTIFSNFIVALITGLSFVLGGVVVKNYVCILPFIFSFFIHLPREIIKDVVDVKGDKSMGIVSLPIIAGTKKSFNIGALSLGILCVILPLPFILGILGLLYILIVLIFAYPLIIYTIMRLLRTPKDDELMKLSNLLKISMVVGLVAMIL